MDYGVFPCHYSQGRTRTIVVLGLTTLVLVDPYHFIHSPATHLLGVAIITIPKPVLGGLSFLDDEVVNLEWLRGGVVLVREG